MPPLQISRCRAVGVSKYLGGANAQGGKPVTKFLQQLWSSEEGQDIAEYAVMLAVILVIVVGTIRLIGSNANNVFSSVGSAIQ
jgi:Flp pilus assembly pilin Flp